MATDLAYKAFPVAATEDLSDPSRRFKAVNIGGTIAASANLAGGILRNAPKSGETAELIFEGITKVLAGAAVSTLGFPLTITTSGFIIAASSGGASIGRALETCSSGDLVQAMVDFTNLGFWRG